MGFIRSLFGSGKEKRPQTPPQRGAGQGAARQPAARDAAPGRPGGKPGDAPVEAPTTHAPGRPVEGEAELATSLAEQPSKQLQRLLGSSEAAKRQLAARILAERAEVTSIRPLINAYLNSADAEVLAALATFGRAVAPPAVRDAADAGIVGERRARLMDILGISGASEAAAAIRPYLENEDAVIHTRACLALARLGDVAAIEMLSSDLERNDRELRTLALDALRQIEAPEARRAVEAHIGRYLGSAGAVPAEIEIAAPRLTAPDVMLSTYAAERIQAAPHALTVVVGPGATRMAASRRAEIQGVLRDLDVRFTTEHHTPEEQIAILEAARDQAVADPTHRVVVFGRLPSPMDRPPLPHFLRKLGGPGYTAKIMIIEPHEVNQVLGWWRYVDETRRIPTDFEVLLAISRPDNSPITEEEYLIYTLTPEAKRREFLRAFVANL